MRGAVLIGLCALALLAPPTEARAYWLAGGSGSGSASTATMPTANQPTATASGRSVTVGWSQNSFRGSPLGSYAGGGYTIKRYAQGSSTAITPSAGCATTISGAGATLECTEAGVPAGDWQYSVQPVLNSFSGDQSPKSAAVAVAAPSLSLAPTSVAVLPATLTGTIDNFISGQTVSFRLDHPSSGPVLSGSIAPSPVPSSGSAAVTVTIPAGTSNGSHTVYAIGSGGDVASRAITVNRPIAFVKNVGQAGCSGTTTSSVTVPLSGVAPGDTLILRLMMRGNSIGAVAATDSRGNSYTADKDVINVDQRMVVFSAAVGTALLAGDTITVTHPNANATGVVVDQFSGIASTGRLDATASAVGTAQPSVSLAANANDLVIGAVSMADQQTVTQPGGGWNPLTGHNLSCSNSANFGAYRIVSSTGTYTYNPTVSNASRWAAAAVAYKPG